jgi:hypothetical protein
MSNTPLSAQSALLGNTGLVITPSAYLQPDASIGIGVSYLPHPYYTVDRETNDNRIIHLSFTFLPFIEVVFGAIKPYGEVYGIGDRTAGFRFRVLKENRIRPQIVIGTQDPFGIAAQAWAQRFCTLYAVASKTIQTPYLGKTSVHLGHGVDWIRAGQHYLIGTFGGLTIQPIPHIEGLLEYDTLRWNMGLRLHVWQFSITTAWIGGRDLCGSAQFNFRLPLHSNETPPVRPISVH